MRNESSRFAPALERLLAKPSQSRRIGPFFLVEQLGQGGFAPVWLAREAYGETFVRMAAVKLFALGSIGNQGQERIAREAQKLCQVEHPNVVRFYALPIDTEAGVGGLAMEYVPGISLGQRLVTEGRLGVEEVIRIGIAVASALDAVHRAGLVHRDVKPDNIVESNGIYKLIDFGIARGNVVADEPKSVAETNSENDVTARLPHGPSGTVGYVDPECYRGNPANSSSDLYGLGATMYSCLTRKSPQKLEGAVDVTFDPGIPPALTKLVTDLLAPVRLDRPPSALVVRERLEGVTKPPSVGRQRRRSLTVVWGVGAALLLGAGTWFLLTHQSEQDPPSAAASNVPEDAETGNATTAEFAMGTLDPCLPPTPAQLEQLNQGNQVRRSGKWFLAGSQPEYYALFTRRDDPGGEAAGISLRSMKGVWPLGFGTLISKLPPKSWHNKRLRMSARVTTQGVEGRAGLWLRIDGLDGKSTAFDNMDHRPIRGDTDLTRYEIVLDVDKQTTNIAYGFLFDGPGWGCVKDLRFESVGTDVPTTDMKSKSPIDRDERFFKPNALTSSARSLGRQHDAWALTGPHRESYTIVTQPKDPEGGAEGISLQALAPASKGVGVLMRELPIEPWLRKRVRMKARLSVGGVKGWAGLWMRVYGHKGELLSFDNMRDRPLHGDIDKEHHAVVMDIPVQTERILYGLLLDGPGWISFDQLEFESVFIDVPTTEMDF
jgi:serine/threonine protein kinase